MRRVVPTPGGHLRSINRLLLAVLFLQTCFVIYLLHDQSSAQHAVPDQNSLLEQASRSGHLQIRQASLPATGTVLQPVQELVSSFPAPTASSVPILNSVVSPAFRPEWHGFEIFVASFHAPIFLVCTPTAGPDSRLGLALT